MTNDAADYRAALENYQRYRQPVQPYGPTDTWFAWKILGVVARIALWVIGIWAFVLYVIADKILLGMFPDSDPDTIGGISAGIAVFLMAWYVIATIRKTRRVRRARFIAAYTPPPMNETFVRVGMVENPEGPWFDADGHPLWERSGTGWVKKA